MLAAACAGSDAPPTMFFSTEETGGGFEPNLPGLAICEVCGVSTECLDYALSLDIRWGIWGGKTSSQRLTIRKTRRRAV
jgi:WhiB family transcriptional regulator, redox-sensing transcriptional regulator